MTDRSPPPIERPPRASTHPIKHLAAAMACVGVSVSFAQDANQMDITARPHQTKAEGRTLGCGIRIVGTVPGKTDADVVPVIDFALNLDEANGVALVRGVFLEGTRGALNSGQRPARQPIEAIWLRVLGAADTAPPTGEYVVSTSDPGAIIYATPMASAAMVLDAAVQKRPVQFGVRPKGADTDRLFNGSIGIAPADQAQVAACAQTARAAQAAAPKQ